MKKTKWLLGICALMALSQVNAAELFRDDFDDGELVDPANANILLDPWVRYKLGFGSVIFSEENGQVNITTNEPGNWIGAGMITSARNPDLNFFGSAVADPQNPHKRVIRVEGLAFVDNALYPFEKEFRLVVFSASPAIEREARVPKEDFFEVVVREDRTYNIISQTTVPGAAIGSVPVSITDPLARIPKVPNAITVELDATDYRVTFEFEGGGLYYYGPHGLVRENWEVMGTDETEAGNFHIGLIASTKRSLGVGVGVSVDSVVVTDGQ